MDERRRLLERAYSRAGALEERREYIDPETGDPVRMTPSQWALAEYDRRHPADPDREPEPPPAAPATAEEADGPDGPEPTAGGRTDPLAPPRRASRRITPYLTAAGGMLLGIALALGVQGTLGFDSPQHTTVGTPSSTPGHGTAVGAGNGDEAATLEAVTEFFAKTPAARGLPAGVTKGFDATSFRPVATTVSMQESSAIYAAHRLDDEYCLVSVAQEGRAAETCGTMDDIARRGLTLTKDAVRDVDGRPLAVTVTWQTDGTISWDAVPSAG